MLGKADTPANERKQEGVQAETEGDKTLGKRKDPQEGGRTIQQRETRRGTMGDKTVRKADTPSPKGNNQGVQWETPSGKRPTKGNKKGYNRRQGETRPSARRTHLPTRGVKRRGTMGGTGRQDPPKKAAAPSNKRKQEGVQWAMGDKGKQERRGTMGDNIGDKTSGRRTHHPTPRQTP